MLAIWKRELKNYFSTPVGYVFLGIFLLVSGTVFTVNCLLTGYSDLVGLYGTLNYVFMLLTPILTMRLMSEEKNKRTDQLLLTSPCPVRAIVAGKFLGAQSMLLLSLLCTAPYLLILLRYSRPFLWSTASSFLGTFLLGSCYVSVGVLMSALTENQVSAAVLTCGFNLAVQFLELALKQTDLPRLAFLTNAVRWVSLYSRYEKFGAGLISAVNIAYYLAFCAVFLCLSAMAVERKR